MLTRAQIISYVTAKLGITDAAAQTQAGTFVDARHLMIWNDSDWRQARMQQSLSVSAGTQDYALDAAFEFIKAARWNQAYEVPIINDVTALQRNPVQYDQNGPVLGIIPLARDGSGIVQIRIVGKPTQAGTLLLIGKAKATYGADPQVPGEDMALVELVMGDLYEWLRQLDKAQYFFQKGAALLAKLRELETEQATEVRGIIPQVQVLENEADHYDSLRPLG